MKHGRKSLEKLQRRQKLHDASKSKDSTGAKRPGSRNRRKQG